MPFAAHTWFVLMYSAKIRRLVLIRTFHVGWIERQMGFAIDGQMLKLMFLFLGQLHIVKLPHPATHSPAERQSILARAVELQHQTNLSRYKVN